MTHAGIRWWIKLSKDLIIDTRMRSFMWRHKFLLFFALTVSLAILFHVQILTAIGHFLVIQQPLREVSLIQALGWDETERIDYAIALFSSGYGNKLYFAGNDETLPFSFNDYGKVVKEYAADKFDLKEEVIITGPSTVSTYEEAISLKRLIYGKKGIKSVLVISSPYHMRRVKMIFNKVLSDEIDLTFRHVPWEKSDNVKNWWVDEDSSAFVITEYIKLVYYFFKYMI